MNAGRHNSSHSNNDDKDKSIGLANIMVAFAAVVVSLTTCNLSKKDSETDLYADLKSRYYQWSEAGEEIKKGYADDTSKHIIHYEISDCSFLYKALDFGDLEIESPPGVLEGRRELFQDKCKVSVYPDTANWEHLKRYWRLSFDEWFSSMELGLAEDLWTDYYSHAIFNSLQRSEYQMVFCSMISGETTFGGHVRAFSNTMSDLYGNKGIQNKYARRWSGKPPFLSATPPACLVLSDAQQFSSYKKTIEEKKFQFLEKLAIFLEDPSPQAPESSDSSISLTIDIDICEQANLTPNLNNTEQCSADDVQLAILATECRDKEGLAVSHCDNKNRQYDKRVFITVYEQRKNRT